METSSSSTVDEAFMQRSLIFSDSLKDLKTLRSQLYSAAEYFESAYAKDDQKQVVMNTLKDYTVKALVNTVDHLGSMSFKVNGLLDEKIADAMETEMHISCIEQRIRTCHMYMDREGLTQQSMVILAPKYHKRYILPVGGTMPDRGRDAVPNYRESTIRGKSETETHQFDDESRPQRKEKHPFRKLRAIHQRLHSLSAAQKVQSTSPSSTKPPSGGPGGARAVSPIPTSNLLMRSESLSRKPSLLKSAGVRLQYPSEPQKPPSMLLHSERNDDNEGEQSPKKSRKFLKSLLSRRKLRKDETLNRYLDEF